MQLTPCVRVYLLLSQPRAPAPAFYTAEPPQPGAADSSAFSATSADAALPLQGAGDCVRCDRCTALQQLMPGASHLLTATGSLRSPQLSNQAAASMQRLARLKLHGRGTAAEQQSSGVDCGASPIVVLPAMARLQEAASLAATPCQHSSMSMQQQQQQQQCRLGISSAVGMAAAHGGGAISQAHRSAASSTLGSPSQQARPAWVVTGRELALHLQRRAELKAAAAAANNMAAAAQVAAPLQSPAPAAAAASRTAHTQLPPGSPAPAAAACDSPAPPAAAAGTTGHAQPLPGSPAPAAAGLRGPPAVAVQQTPHQNPLFEAADAADAVDAADTQLATNDAAYQQHDAVQV
jgi:hypothetical protein